MKLDSSVLRTVSIGDSIIVLFGLSSYEISVIVVIMDRAADYIGIYFSSFDVLTIYPGDILQGYMWTVSLFYSGFLSLICKITGLLLHTSRCARA